MAPITRELPRPPVGTVFPFGDHSKVVVVTGGRVFVHMDPLEGIYAPSNMFEQTRKLHPVNDAGILSEVRAAIGNH